MKHILLLVSIILAAGVSCGDAVATRDRATLYIHLGAEPGNLNPITSTEAVAGTITAHLYETLLERNYDTLELEPELAQRWEMSPNGLVYRFYLKKGVLWSDGVELTADDVVYSFNKLKSPDVESASWKVYFMDVSRIRRVDKYTVEFHCTQPYFMRLEFLGGMPIVPKHIFDDGTDFNQHPAGRHPVGTGPYMFDRWDTNKRIVLKVNPRYRGNPPDIRRVVYRVVPEENVALLMLKKGELDVMTVSNLQWVRQTDTEKFKKDFHKLKYFTPNYNYIGWNSQREWFRDKRVRRAMTHLVNRKAILDKLLFGLGKIVTGTFYIFSDNYDPAIEPWPYDREKGIALLREAGWADSDKDGILDKNGKKFSFTFSIASASKFSERLAIILKEDLSKAGIEMNINRYEWAVFVKKLTEKDFDAVTLAWSLGYSGDPYQLWHSSQINEGSNYCGFLNAESDRIIEKARVEFDDKKRVQLFRRFNHILHDEQPYTFMFCNPSLVVVSRNFDNVKVHTMGLNITEWKVRKGQ
ncbi:MAG TPA: peptide-binding protein [Spirochaetota bacterium]|nr:peptide-binding protein [Spirochaetota bacterium]